MERGYRDFEALLAGLSPAQRVTPGVIGEWSVKDILAHIAEHARRAYRWLEIRVRGQIPEVFQPYAMPEPDLARLNDQIYRQYRNHSLAEVRANFEQAYLEGLAWVRSAADADLFEAQLLALAGGEPLWEAVAANTYWHYTEHAQDICRWLEAQP